MLMLRLSASGDRSTDAAPFFVSFPPRFIQQSDLFRNRTGDHEAMKVGKTDDAIKRKVPGKKSRQAG
jgi:hypothetical protein